MGGRSREFESLIPDVKKTIAVDFDGVIHRYSKGWHDGTIYDPPMPGAIEGLKQLLESYFVFVFTTRGVESVVQYLREHEVNAIADNSHIYPDRKFWNIEDTILVTNRKLAAIVYIDDRALKFENWQQVLGILNV